MNKINILSLFKRVSLLALFVLLAGGTAQAVKYMSLKRAIKQYLPADSKVVKITKHPSAEERKILFEDYGWKAKAKKYVIYAGKKDGQYTGFVMIVPEIFGTCFHKFAIGIKPDGHVIDTTIVELSCPRAMPINKKSFLKQFRGKTHQDALTVNTDVDGVTGATYSSEVAATATRKALALHNLYFGKHERVHVSAAVKKARAEAEAKIQKAMLKGDLFTEEQKAAFAKDKDAKERALKAARQGAE